MPVVTVDINRFSKILGREVTVQELVEKMPSIGVDIEDVGPNYVKVEYNPNRPDFGTLVGLARAYKGITEEETGIPTYTALRGDFSVSVDPTVQGVRPIIGGIVARNLPMDEELLLELIAYQEDLHMGIGRGRRKVAIGFHNLDVIRFPLLYKAPDDEGLSFTPLGGREPMTIAEILEKTEVGRKYGHIVRATGRYPIILDAEGRVLSFPPVINAELTRVTPETRNLFVDVTGTDKSAVLNTVNLIATFLYDCGAEIYTVSIKYPDRTESTPDLSYREIESSKSLINDLLGLSLSDEQIVRCLRKCRLEGVIEGDRVKVVAPPYRVDLMHPVDIVEEVVIGYGYENMTPTLPEVSQVGSRHPKTEFRLLMSELMVGFGFEEVVTFTLSNKEVQFRKMHIPEEGCVKVLHPKAGELEILRVWIIPHLLSVLRTSRKERYPQKIFEIGRVARTDGRIVIERDHLAFAITHSKAGYSDVKAILDRLFDMMECKFVVEPTKHQSFIPGRVGEVIVAGNRRVGIVGEIHPIILEEFSLENPVAVAELDLDELRLIYTMRLT